MTISMYAFEVQIIFSTKILIKINLIGRHWYVRDFELAPVGGLRKAMTKMIRISVFHAIF